MAARAVMYGLVRAFMRSRVATLATLSLACAASRLAMAQAGAVPSAPSIPAVPQAVHSAGRPGRPLSMSDMYREREVEEAELSRDGAWIAYSVKTIDSARDERVSAIYETSWDGQTTRRLTWSRSGEHLPHWRPDGRAVAFLSGRGGAHDSADQVWVMPHDAEGGEAECVTDLPGGVSDYAWSPTGKQLAVIAWIARDIRGIADDRIQFLVLERGKQRAVTELDRGFQRFRERRPVGRSNVDCIQRDVTGEDPLELPLESQ